MVYVSYRGNVQIRFADLVDHVVSRRSFSTVRHLIRAEIPPLALDIKPLIFRRFWHPSKQLIDSAKKWLVIYSRSGSSGTLKTVLRLELCINKTRHQRFESEKILEDSLANYLQL